ncbi:YidC/Oxa1 family insertase periplasmic-domain containing protein [Isosphaeraceae bacterium EP7]
MSPEKRLVLFFVLSVGMMLTTQMLLERWGLIPKPQPQQAAALAAAQAKDKEKPGEVSADPPKADAPVAAKAKDDAAKEPASIVAAKANEAPKAPDVPAVTKAELTLGSTATDSGYALEVQLTQDGAGVADLRSSKYDAELDDNRRAARRPLSFIETKPDDTAPPSLSFRLVQPDGAGAEALAPSPLDLRRWEVVRDDKGRAIRPVFADPKDADTAKPGAEIGQEIVFRTKVLSPAVEVTKTYRLEKGKDAFRMEVKFASETDQTTSYTLLGPHGIPIEGEWYTGTFRDMFFGRLKSGAVKIDTYSAYDVGKAAATDEPYRNTELPLRFAGVENQYFAVFFAPEPPPTSQEDRIDIDTVAVVTRTDQVNAQKNDVSVEMRTRPISVGPDRTVTHAYSIFAGPKTNEALAAYGAEDLASYRKNVYFTIPGGATVAKYFIDPLLKRIYALTVQVGGFFGTKRGSYGIAIILLTMTVRLIMFPLGRKQALAAKKMQDLQPQLTALRVKYKDQKDVISRETFALYKRAGVNPVGGCLPALIQLPIFVGLWQALNNSVALRHSQFLWIRNLAAPDMLFQFPSELPFLGKYFNILPLFVVSLMLVQMKLFAPPATTPEQEMNQKMMKYMMLFMAVMFYKVPAGLGLYFITSSLWQICERLLLPKAKPGDLIDVVAEVDPSGGNGNGAEPKVTRFGGLRSRFEKLLEEAQKDTSTIRNDRQLTDQVTDKEKDKGNRGGSTRPRPGGKRR